MKSRKSILFSLLAVALILSWFWSRNKQSEPILVSEDVDNSQEEASQSNKKAVNPVSRNTASSNGNSQSAQGQNQISSSGKETLEQFLKRLDPKADWRVDKIETGRVISISGSMIKGYSETPEKMLSFTQTIAQLTGVPAQQMVLSDQQPDSPPESKITKYDQMVGDYKVFSSYIKIFTRDSDGSIYFVGNETRDVGTVDLRIQYNFQDVKEVALQRYANKRGAIVENSPTKPVIYSSVSGQGELAWEVVVFFEGPTFGRQHLLVSAASKTILKDVSLVEN